MACAPAMSSGFLELRRSNGQNFSPAATASPEAATPASASNAARREVVWGVCESVTGFCRNNP